MAALLLGSSLLPNTATTVFADGAPPIHSDLSNLPNMLVTMGDALSALSSEAEAQAFFSSHLAPLMEDGTGPGKTKSSSGGPPGLTELGGQLAAELAAWQLATLLRHAAESGESEALPALQPRLDRQRWLLTEQRSALRHAATLLVVLARPRAVAESSDDSKGYQGYQDYLDRTYPDFIGSEQSWVRLAEEGGPASVTRRLMEFWRDQAISPRHEAMAARYFDTRLRPVFIAYLGAHAERAEAQADRHARQYWMQCRDRGKDLRQRKDLMRLCGTWQWTVHNHQNHQDHKTTIAFPAPEIWEAGTFDGIRPAQVRIHGDSVYLRWVFQGGIQEDSLLFGKEGQRLEGTFVNSAGAWGSISGKRTSPCQGKR